MLSIAKRLCEHLRLDFSNAAAISFFFGSSSLILHYVPDLTKWKALVLKFSKLVITFLGKIIYNRLYFIVVGVGLYLELKRSSFVVVAAIASWVSTECTFSFTQFSHVYADDGVKRQEWDSDSIMRSDYWHSHFCWASHSSKHSAIRPCTILCLCAYNLCAHNQISDANICAVRLHVIGVFTTYQIHMKHWP